LYLRAREATLSNQSTPPPRPVHALRSITRLDLSAADEIDAASRAASIRAAREKFEADQRAKEAKYEKEAHKLAEREYRKQQKKEEIQTRKSEAHDRSDYNRSRSVSDAQNEKASRPSVGGRQYSDHRQAHSNSLPKHVRTVDVEKQSGAAPQVTKSRAAKGRWLRFVTWFKTRLLRMSRKVPR
jgi:hypothetical protein